MSLNTQINLIVIALPKSIQDKLDKKYLVNIEDLMSKLKQFGQIIEKKEKQKNQVSQKPCPHCEGLGYPNRFYDISVCRLKKNSKLNKTKNDTIRLVNNAEVQDIVATAEEAKNDRLPH